MKNLIDIRFRIHFTNHSPVVLNFNQIAFGDELNNLLFKGKAGSIKAVCQFTGAHYLSGQEVYEGDISFDEVEEDHGDRRFFSVCTWIEEFGGFTWLNIPGEYHDYLSSGVMALDGSMPYNMEGHGGHYKGNIHENPDLIENYGAKLE